MKVKKKWLAGIGLLLVLLIGSVYIFIPGELTVSKVQLVKCNMSGAFRIIGDEGSWKKWWPGGGINGYFIRVTGSVYPEVGVVLCKGEASGIDEGERDGTYEGDRGMTNKKDKRATNEAANEDANEDAQGVRGMISLLSAGVSDSTAILWKCRLAAGWNPLRRVLRFREAIDIRNTIAAALSSMGVFLEKKENIYGMDVRNAMLMDSTLIVVQIVTTSYPSTTEVYRNIHAIRDYVARLGAKETDYPMLHVNRRNDSSYEGMIAIPIDRELKGAGKFEAVRFVPWKVLTGEVRGGPSTAQRAIEQLALYIIDYPKTPMAASFQSLVTERDKETDTSRWITRVVQPVP